MALVTAIALLGIAAAAHAYRITALTAPPFRLLNLSPDHPGTILSDTPISGLAGGELVLGIDQRPAPGVLYTGVLYLLTQQGTAAMLRSVDPVSGAVSAPIPLAADPADATNPFTTLNASGGVGIDFNPVTDQLRVVTASRQNLRVHPLTGLVTTDTDLNPGTPAVTAIGYTNSRTGATSTKLYDYDVGSNTLFIQNPPSNGTLSAVGGSSGISVGDSNFVGMDTADLGATIYLSGPHDLYTLDPGTAVVSHPGVATALGKIGPGTTTVVDIAVTPGTDPECKGKTATIFSLLPAATLRGTAGPDVIAGGAGKDKVTAGGGKDLVCAGGGRDNVNGGGGRDRLYGDAGKDKLLGKGGNDVLSGGAGRDSCVGGPGKDKQKSC